MPTRRVGCCRLRRPTRARVGLLLPRSERWTGKPCATGCCFNAGGPEGVIDRKPAGAARRLTPEQEAELAALIEAGPDFARDGVVRWRCVDLRQLILSRWNIAYHERTIGKLLRRLGFSHISARPRHLGQDPAQIEAFKKISPSEWARSRQSSTRRRR
jgi:transposase